LEELKKDVILADLQILNDEPASNPLFNFQAFGDQLSKILLDNTIPTPFAIGLDGEWGSGKSTLLLYIENIIKERTKIDLSKSWKVIYFNAWKYEKLDPVESLMQVISNEYENKKENEKWKKIVINYGFLALSTGL
jgi:predicted KAP-like P-loop ATPase